MVQEPSKTSGAMATQLNPSGVIQKTCADLSVVQRRELCFSLNTFIRSGDLSSKSRIGVCQTAAGVTVHEQFGMLTLVTCLVDLRHARGKTFLLSFLLVTRIRLLRALLLLTARRVNVSFLTLLERESGTEGKEDHATL